MADRAGMAGAPVGGRMTGATPNPPELSPAEYARVKALFVELCDLPDSERADRLRQVSPAHVRAELGAMLAADSRPDVFGDDATGRTAAAAAPLPVTIGPYRVVRLVGEGGMGRVFEATQEFPHRTVAVKVIRSGSFSPSLLRRFQQEVDVLARLRHPSIAQIYDAGRAQIDGQERPYFAMEFVSGLSLTRHCN